MWQEFYTEHADRDFELITVAMDVQGAEKAQPWVKRAGATYPALVDRSNILGERFGFQYVPLTILFDENGRMVRGPQHTDIRKRDQREMFTRWVEQGILPEEPQRTNTASGAGGLKNPEIRLRFGLATELLQRGEAQEAIYHLRQALERDPDNWIIRKQIWAIEHPERFYEGDVDFQWQKEQLEGEGKSGEK